MPECILCNQEKRTARFICIDCEQALPWHCGCNRCGNPLVTTEHNETLCKFCLLTPPPYQQLIAAWHYEFPIDTIISQFKFSDQLRWQTFLSHNLAKCIQSHPSYTPPDLIIPMPLHRKRLRQRGYNQAQLIAKRVAKHLKLPMHPKTCQRHKHTTPQVDLPATKRQHNVKGIFRITKSVNNQTIAIVDDVVTTGSTVASLSQTLLEAGATQVVVWCLAKT